ncbi:hypothetical protein Gotur_024378 [Gossypium turneri]
MDSVKTALFKRHSNYSISVDEIGMKLDFVWAPYVLNLTHLLTDFKTKKKYPDVMVMGAGLWHMLHVSDPSDYELVLQTLKSSLVSLFPFSTDIANAYGIAEVVVMLVTTALVTLVMLLIWQFRIYLFLRTRRCEGEKELLFSQETCHKLLLRVPVKKLSSWCSKYECTSHEYLASGHDIHGLMRVAIDSELPFSC